MKILMILASAMIALQAVSLFQSPLPRQNFHSLLQLFNNYNDSSFFSCCCTVFEEMRLLAVAFTFASAYLLFVGEAITPAIISQGLWVVSENLRKQKLSINDCYSLLGSLLLLVLMVNFVKTNKPEEKEAEKEVVVQKGQKIVLDDKQIKKDVKTKKKSKK